MARKVSPGQSNQNMGEGGPRRSTVRARSYPITTKSVTFLELEPVMLFYWQQNLAG